MTGRPAQRSKCAPPAVALCGFPGMIVDLGPSRVGTPDFGHEGYIHATLAERRSSARPDCRDCNTGEAERAGRRRCLLYVVRSGRVAAVAVLGSLCAEANGEGVTHLRQRLNHRIALSRSELSVNWMLCVEGAHNAMACQPRVRGPGREIRAGSARTRSGEAKAEQIVTFGGIPSRSPRLPSRGRR